MAQKLAAKGLLGWLGRQVGYVTGAIKSDVGPKTIYRAGQTQEVKLPSRPDVTLRRTVVDEVIVDPQSGEKH